MCYENETAVSFLKDIKMLLEKLWVRWEAEKEYEDIADYALPLKPFAEKYNIQAIKITGSPFGLKFRIEAKKYVIKFTRGGKITLTAKA